MVPFRLLGFVTTSLLLLSVSTFADHIDDAVTSDLRPKSDTTRDLSRRPADVLRFLGLEEGMTALDIFAGSGYYTEILSHAVGPNGRVTSHNNNAYLSIIRNIDERYEGGRLPNVTRVAAEPPLLPLEAQTYDFALMALAYHDFFIETEDWPAFDVPKMLEVIFRSLKPGAIVGIIDHAANEGAGVDSARRLHRIEPAFVVKQMEAAGFVLEASSDLLANPDDPHDIPMWDPKVRSQTDRFIFRFRKPS